MAIWLDDCFIEDIQYPLFMMGINEEKNKWVYAYFVHSESKKDGNRLVYNVSDLGELVYDEYLIKRESRLKI